LIQIGCCALLGQNGLLVRTTTSALVNPGERRQTDTENIKTRDKAVGKRKAQRPDCFVPPGACGNPFATVDHAAAAAKPAKKFHIFHKRHIRKPSSFDERRPPAENPMIATSHPEQKPRIMRKAVRQSVNNTSRQADPKVTATDSSIPDYTANFIQASRWHFGVCMQEPENIAAGRTGAGIHLYRTAAFAAPNELITESYRKLIRAVGACTIDHNDFRSRRSLAQMLEKRPYQRRLIQNRNND